MQFAERNYKAIINQEALIEKLGYGIIDTSVEFHNKRIVRQTFYGKERKRYGKDNFEEAPKDILRRIKQSMDKNETTKITFELTMRNGRPEQLLWMSNLTVTYDDHGTVDKTEEK